MRRLSREPCRDAEAEERLRHKFRAKHGYRYARATDGVSPAKKARGLHEADYFIGESPLAQGAGQPNHACTILDMPDTVIDLVLRMLDGFALGRLQGRYTRPGAGKTLTISKVQVERAAALRVKSLNVVKSLRCPGCLRAPTTPWSERALAPPSQMRLLSELEWFRRELTFTDAAPGMRLEPAGTACAVAPALERATAVCRKRWMRAGIHQATFIVNSLLGECRIGVVRADFDPRAECLASDTEAGWAWSSTGKVWHNGAELAPAAASGTPLLWRAGDRLGVRLDLEKGLVTGYKNGKRLGVLAEADELKGGGGTVAEWSGGNVPPTQVLCWCVEMWGTGSTIRVQGGEFADPDATFHCVTGGVRCAGAPRPEAWEQEARDRETDQSSAN